MHNSTAIYRGIARQNYDSGNISGLRLFLGIYLSSVFLSLFKKETTEMKHLDLYALGSSLIEKNLIDFLL